MYDKQLDESRGKKKKKIYMKQSTKQKQTKADIFYYSLSIFFLSY